MQIGKGWDPYRVGVGGVQPTYVQICNFLSPMVGHRQLLSHVKLGKEVDFNIFRDFSVFNCFQARSCVHALSSEDNTDSARQELCPFVQMSTLNVSNVLDFSQKRERDKVAWSAECTGNPAFNLLKNSNAKKC